MMGDDIPCQLNAGVKSTIPAGHEHLDRASEVLKHLHEIENTLFMFEERLLGPRRETESTDRVNPVPETNGSFSGAMADYQLRQRDSLTSIERIVQRLQEFC